MWKYVCNGIGVKAVKPPQTISQIFKSNFFRYIFHQLNLFLLTVLHGISVSHILNKAVLIFPVIS